MKLVAEIHVADTASQSEIEKAKAKAQWRIIESRESIMLQTDLERKCGSCEYFCPIKGRYLKARGNCTNENAKVHLKHNRDRTSTCKAYKRKNGWEKRYL